MACSEARLNANRANAQKPTGPKTEAGKIRARRNALKHGMSGLGLCLLPEDEARLKDRLVGWLEELRPQGEVQDYLILQAVTASIQLDRCHRAQAAALAERLRTAERDWDERYAAEVAALAARLMDDPVTVSRQLRRTAAGCRWLRQRWEPLAAALQVLGQWDEEQIALAQALLGLAPDDPRAAELRRLANFAEHAFATLDRLEAADQLSADHPAVRALLEQRPRDIAGPEPLQQWVAAEMAALEAEAERLWREIDGPSRAEAKDRVLGEASVAGVLLQRYEGAQTQRLLRLLQQVARQQQAFPTLSEVALGSKPSQGDWVYRDGRWVEVPASWGRALWAEPATLRNEPNAAADAAGPSAPNEPNAVATGMETPGGEAGRSGSEHAGFQGPEAGVQSPESKIPESRIPEARAPRPEAGGLRPEAGGTLPAGGFPRPEGRVERAGSLDATERGRPQPAEHGNPVTVESAARRPSGIRHQESGMAASDPEPPTAPAFPPRVSAPNGPNAPEPGSSPAPAPSEAPAAGEAAPASPRNEPNGRLGGARLLVRRSRRRAGVVSGVLLRLVAV
ncbi:MAG: hypothetical protein IRY99_10640, partial [Isosphaeraceae bacterium]|nr:hypothetical protein [Isosphaeraceae bacterium]